MANFLKIGAGSRASAMGDAFVAMTDDASATYWNPGGLVLVEKNEAMFQSTSWMANTSLYYLAVAVPFGELGTLGANIYSFNSGDMEETTVQQPDGTGRQFSAGNFSMGLSFARKFTDRFSVGFTVKYISENLSRETASAFAFDIGSVFKTDILNGMRIGLALSNLGGAMKLGGPDLNVRHDINTGLPTNKFVNASLGTQEWQLPLLFRIGLGTYVIKNENTSWSVEGAINDSRDYAVRYNMGT
ncbi:MAG: PorV/PorQ family protein, partial [Melioribacteraceae bacterium]